MQRWKHAGRGPKSTLIVGLLLGVASLVLYNAAYAAAEPPYPGSPALPGIPLGPKLGCLPTGTSKTTWVCGFNARSHTTFKVNGHAAGTYQADTNGCVLITLTFTNGEVSVNGNAPVPIRTGTNYLIIQGRKTTPTGTYTVGLRMAFTIPHGNAQTCVPVTTSTSFPPATSTIVRPRFPRITTSTRFQPTTLAKVIETPLEISPNKVILESSLMAAVLAAMLSAGALGSIWNAGSSAATGAATGAAVVGAEAASSLGEEGGPATPEDGSGPPPGGGDGPVGGAPDGPAEPPAAPDPPTVSDPPTVPDPPAAMDPGESVVPPITNAFTRTNLRRPNPGGGGP
jgi:hypothetical protein